MNKSKPRGGGILSDFCRGKGLPLGYWSTQNASETQQCEISSLDAIYPGCLKIINKGELKDSDIGLLKVEDEGIDFSGIWCTSSYEYQVHAGETRYTSTSRPKLVQYKLILTHEMDIEEIRGASKVILLNVTYPLNYPPEPPDVTLAFNSNVLVIQNKEAEEAFARVCIKILAESPPLFQERITALCDYLREIIRGRGDPESAVWAQIRSAAKRKSSLTVSPVQISAGASAISSAPPNNATGAEFKRRGSAVAADLSLTEPMVSLVDEGSSGDEKLRSRFNRNVLQELNQNLKRKPSSVEMTSSNPDRPSNDNFNDDSELSASEEHYNTSNVEASSSCNTGDEGDECGCADGPNLVKPNPLDMYMSYSTTTLLRRKKRALTTEKLVAPLPPKKPGSRTQDTSFGSVTVAVRPRSNIIEATTTMRSGSNTRSLIPRTISLPRLSASNPGSRGFTHPSRILNDFTSFSPVDTVNVTDDLIVNLTALNKFDKQVYSLRVFRLEKILADYAILSRKHLTKANLVVTNGDQILHSVMSHFISAIQSFSQMEHPHIGRIYSTWCELVSIPALSSILRDQLITSPAVRDREGELCCVIQLEHLSTPRVMSFEGRRLFARDKSLPVRFFQQTLETICFLHKHSMAFLTDYCDVRLAIDDVGPNVNLRYPSFHVLLILAIQSNFTMGSAPKTLAPPVSSDGYTRNTSSEKGQGANTQRHSSSSPQILAVTAASDTRALSKSSNTIGGYQNLNRSSPSDILYEMLDISPVIARCLDLHSTICFSPIKSAAGACHILRKADVVIFCHFMRQVLTFFDQQHSKLAIQCDSILSLKNLELVPDPVEFMQAADVIVHRDELKKLLYVLSSSKSDESHALTLCLLNKKGDPKRTVPYLFQSHEDVLAVGWVEDLSSKLSILEWQISNFIEESSAKLFISINFIAYSDNYQFSSLVYKEILLSQLYVTALEVLVCSTLVMPTVLGVRSEWQEAFSGNTVMQESQESINRSLRSCQIKTLLGVWEHMSYLLIDERAKIVMLPKSALHMFWPAISHRPISSIVRGTDSVSRNALHFGGFCAIVNVYARPKVYGHPDLSSRYFWANDYDGCNIAFAETFLHLSRQLKVLSQFAPDWNYIVSFPAEADRLRNLILADKTTSSAIAFAEFDHDISARTICKALDTFTSRVNASGSPARAEILNALLSIRERIQTVCDLVETLYDRTDNIIFSLHSGLPSAISASTDAWISLVARIQTVNKPTDQSPAGCAHNQKTLPILAGYAGIFCLPPENKVSTVNAFIELNVELLIKIINYKEFDQLDSCSLARLKSPQILIVFQRWSMSKLCRDLSWTLQKLGFCTELRLKSVISYNRLKKDVFMRNPGLGFIIRVQNPNKVDLSDDTTTLQFRSFPELIHHLLKIPAKAKSNLKNSAVHQFLVHARNK